MDFVKSILRIELSQALSPWLEIRSMVRNVGDKPEAEISGQPIVIDLKEKKQRIIFGIKTFEIEQESSNSVDESIEIALEKLKRMNESAQLSSIKQTWFNSIYIESFRLPFHELLIKMKGKFLQPNDMVEKATDIGITFDLLEGDALKHSQIGPMDSNQLTTKFLNWPRDNVPDNFIFMGLQYIYQKEFDFSLDTLRSILEDAKQWQSEQAAMILQEIKEGDRT